MRVLNLLVQITDKHLILGMKPNAQRTLVDFILSVGFLGASGLGVKGFFVVWDFGSGGLSLSGAVAGDLALRCSALKPVNF